CAIIKHTNPCGTATGKTLAEAYKKALECDPVSAFGGVIGVNRPIDADAAEEMAKLFLEVIAAPSFDESARATFAAKKNLRLIEISHAPQKWVLKNVSGGILVQDADVRPLSENDLKVVTKRHPTAEEKRALLFAWKVCKHVKSNAILYARDGQTVGVGAGQMSRVDSCKIGAQKAVLPLKGTVAASDAFQPPIKFLKSQLTLPAMALLSIANFIWKRRQQIKRDIRRLKIFRISVSDIMNQRSECGRSRQRQRFCLRRQC